MASSGGVSSKRRGRRRLLGSAVVVALRTATPLAFSPRLVGAADEPPIPPQTTFLGKVSPNDVIHVTFSRVVQNPNVSAIEIVPLGGMSPGFRVNSGGPELSGGGPTWIGDTEYQSSLTSNAFASGSWPYYTDEPIDVSDPS